MNITRSKSASSLHSGYKWTGISTIFLIAISILQTGILARILTKEDFGIIAILYIIIQIILSISDFGFGNLMIQNQNLSQKTKSTLYWLIIFLGIIFTVLLYSSTPLISFLRPGLSETFLTSLKLISLAVIFQSIGTPFRLHFQKILRFNEIAFSEIIGALLGFFLTITLAFNGYGVYSLVIGFIANALVKSLIIFYCHLKFWKPDIHFDFSDLKDHIRFGAFQLGEKVFNGIYSSIDKLLVGIFVSTASLGAYSIAYRMMVRPVSIVNLIMTRVGFPLFSSIQSDSAKIKSLYLDSIKIISLYIFPLSFGLFCIADDLFLLWLGQGWQDAVMVFKIIIFLAIFIGLSNPLYNWMLGKGYVALIFWTNILGMILNTTALIISSKYGLQGMAWAVLITMGGVMFLLDLYLMYRYEKILPLEIIKTMLPFLIFSLIMTIFILVVKQLNPIENISVNCFLYTILGALSYVTLLYLFHRRYFLKILNSILNNKPIEPLSQSGSTLT